MVRQQAPRHTPTRAGARATGANFSPNECLTARTSAYRWTLTAAIPRAMMLYSTTWRDGVDGNVRQALHFARGR